MEQKHEELAKEVTALTATVGRVEQNQAHATELNKLRFDALDAGIKSFGAQLGDFMKRVEGIISGEVETTGSRQGQAIIADFTGWRKSVDADLATLLSQNVRQSGINAGVGATFGTGKAIVVTAASVVVAVCAVLNLLHVI